MLNQEELNVLRSILNDRVADIGEVSSIYIDTDITSNSVYNPLNNSVTFTTSKDIMNISIDLHRSSSYLGIKSLQKQSDESWLVTMDSAGIALECPRCFTEEDVDDNITKIFNKRYCSCCGTRLVFSDSDRDMIIDRCNNVEERQKEISEQKMYKLGNIIDDCSVNANDFITNNLIDITSNSVITSSTIANVSLDTENLEDMGVWANDISK